MTYVTTQILGLTSCIYLNKKHVNHLLDIENWKVPTKKNLPVNPSSQAFEFSLAASNSFLVSMIPSSSTKNWQILMASQKEARRNKPRELA